MLPRLLVAATIGLLLALALRPAALSDDEWETNGALIWFADVQGIYVREHDDSWTTWIRGAPEIVNGTFLSKYGTRIVDGPLPTPTPTPEPTPAPAPTAAPARNTSGGFIINGRGAATTQVEASGRLACSAEVTGNKMRNGQGDQFNVHVHGAGYRPAGDGLLGLKRGPARRSIGGGEGAVVEVPPKVIYLGAVEDLRQSFLGPYTVGVYAAPRGTWTVRCDPVEPLPASRGFTVTGTTRSGPVVWGEDVVVIGGDPAGLLVCDAIWNPPHHSYRTYGPGFQWTLWGQDGNGERVSYGNEQRGYQRVLRKGDRVWLGQERPGEYAAFLPPYSFQVFSAGAWRINCEPTTPPQL